MHTRPAIKPYKRHRFPVEIISHCIWLYFRCCLSSHNVEELMAERAVILTYEGVRYWCRTCGRGYANEARRWRSRPGDPWYLEEVLRTRHGGGHDLWRAAEPVAIKAVMGGCRPASCPVGLAAMTPVLPPSCTDASPTSTGAPAPGRRPGHTSRRTA